MERILLMSLYTYPKDKKLDETCEGLNVGSSHFVDVWFDENDRASG